MKKTYVFFFSCILLLPLMIQAQDSTRLINSVTLIGHLDGPLIHLLNKNRSSYAAGIDVQFRKDIYLGMSGGVFSYQRNEDYYQYESSGNFFKAGFKYDFLKRQQADSKDITFVSLRFAYASFSHDATDIRFRYNYFGEQTYSVAEEKMNAFWVEVGGGIRVELISNFMLGWNLHGAIMLNKPKYEVIPPYLIPGFGKAESSFVLGLEYNIAYIIPFTRSKQKITR